MVIYKLRDWIPAEKLDIPDLAINAHAGIIPLIEQNIMKKKTDDKFFWSWISENTEAIEFLEKHPDKIDYSRLANNRAAIRLIEKRLKYENSRGFWFYLMDWIRVKIFRFRTLQTDWILLNYNSAALCVLKSNPHLINWKILSHEDWAIELLEQNLDKVCFKELSENSAAIHILEENLDKVDWSYFCLNKNAIKIFEKYPDKKEKIDWNIICHNSHAISFLNENIDKLDSISISQNSAAIPLLRKHKHLIHCAGLMMYNESSELGEFINENMEDILNYFRSLPRPLLLKLIKEIVRKEYSIYFIEKDFEKVILLFEKYPSLWNDLSENPAIFVYDYAAMRAARARLHEELIRVALHPVRVWRYLTRFCYDLNDGCE